MKFYEALKEVMENGKKARRRDWTEDAYIYAKDGMILEDTGTFYDPVSAALSSDDWEIVKEKVKKSHTTWVLLYENSYGYITCTFHSKEAAEERCRIDKPLIFKEVTFEWEEKV